MNPDDIRQLYCRQRRNGGPITTLVEWQQLLPAMYKTLVSRARTVPYDLLPITYKDVGAQIDLKFVPDNVWWRLKMACLLGACAKFEYTHDRPMLTSIVISSETGTPGQGFWGIDAVPPNLRIDARHQDHLKGVGRDAQREALWVQAMRKVHDIWTNPELGEQKP